MFSEYDEPYTLVSCNALFLLPIYMENEKDIFLQSFIHVCVLPVYRKTMYITVPTNSDLKDTTGGARFVDSQFRSFCKLEFH